MPVTFVQSNGADGTGASVSVTLSGVVAGNLLAAHCFSQTNSTFTAGMVTGGGTWNLTKVLANPNGGSTGSCGIFECRSATGGSPTVTFNPSNSGAGIAIAVQEFSGAAATPDDGSNGTNFAANTTTPTAGSITTTGASDAVVASTCDGANSQTWAAGTGYTKSAFQNSSSNIAWITEYQTGVAAGTINPGITASATDKFCCVGAAFQPTGGGGGSPQQQLTLLGVGCRTLRAPRPEVYRSRRSRRRAALTQPFGADRLISIPNTIRGKTLINT